MNKYAGDHSFDPYLADQQQFHNGKYWPYMSLKAEMSHKKSAVK